ncbi:hypothetical protein BTJ39_12660 [Izhakiella australiensis]|uniref:Uncharacterized protein n=1 Tax=Izhakiella australiensis TaxID=1926881 RepID=A0A1S8YKC8_9GAMM|nr:hypothetical protein BTJ39_12660 [Izhakiella australiensis]
MGNGIRFLLKSQNQVAGIQSGADQALFFSQSDEEAYGGGEGPADFSRLVARDGHASGHTDVLVPVRKAAGPSVTWVPGLQQ